MPGDIDFAELGFAVRSDGVVVAADRLEELEKQTKKAETAQERLEKQADKVGKQMQRLGRNLSLYVTTPLLAIAGATVKLGADFDSTLSKMVTLVGISRQEMQQFRKEILALAPAVGRSPVELADALFAITSAGQRGAQAMATLTAAAKASAIGLGDTRDIALAAVAAVTAYGEENLNSAEAVEILIGTVEQGNLEAADLAGSLGKVIGLAAQVGAEFKDVGGFIAAFTRQGVAAAEAVTGLRGVLTILAREPTAEAEAAFAEMNLTIAEFRRQVQDQGFINAFQDLVNRADAAGVSMARVIPEVEALVGSLAVFKSEGAGAIEITNAVADAVGSMEQRFKDMQELDPEFAFAQMRAEIQALFIDLSRDLLPAVIEVAGEIRALAQWFRELHPETQTTVVRVLALTAALGPLLIVLGSVTRITAALIPLFTALAGPAVLGRLAVLLSPAGAIAVGLGIIIKLIGDKYVQSIEDAILGTQRYIGTLQDLARAGDTLGMQANLSSVNEQIERITRERATLVEQMEDLQNRMQNRSGRFDSPLFRMFGEGDLEQMGRDLKQLERELDHLNQLRLRYETEIEAFTKKTVNPKVLEELARSFKFLEEITSASGGKEPGVDAKAFQELLDHLDPAAKAMRELAEARDMLNKMRGKLGEEEFQRLAEALERSDLAFAAFADRIGEFREVNPQVLTEFEELSNWLDNHIKEQEEFNRRIQELRDIADPVGALLTQFVERTFDLDRAVRRHAMSEAERTAILAVLREELDKNIAAAMGLEEATDHLREAALEATRQMTQAFLNMWQDILSGGEGAFDGLLRGLESMLAQVNHNLSTARIGEELNNALDDVEGNFNFKNLAQGIGAAISLAVGAEIGGGGQGAQIGASIGGAIGNIWGPIGQAIGALLGGLAGGLFDRDPLTTIGGVDFSSFAADAQRIETPLGEVISIRARGGVGGFDEAGTFGEQAGRAIEKFDQAIFESLQAIGGEEQLEVIREALKNWGGTWRDGAITIENILESRFDAILATFGDDVQSFVGLADDFEKQVKRFDIALRAQKLFEDMPDLFEGRNLNEFLTVIDAIAGKTGDLGEAFGFVLEQLTQITAAKELLRNFADSDFIADYERLVMLQNETPVDTLTRLSSELFDAAANFDNTPDQLVEIAQRFGDIRQAGLDAIAHIDAAWKGLTATIDRLRQDTLDIIAGPKSEREIFVEAAGLVDLARTAQTPEELTRLVSQFDSLIRQLTPETAQRLGANLIDLIDRFQSAADASFERVRDQTLDAIASMQVMADAFLTRIPDALALVASTNERAAMALETIAGTSPTGMFAPVSGQPFDISGLTSVMDSSLSNQSQILADGTNMMADALQSGTANLQENIASAIQRGFGNAHIVVNVQLSSNSLANQ